MGWGGVASAFRKVGYRTRDRVTDGLVTGEYQNLIYLKKPMGYPIVDLKFTGQTHLPDLNCHHTVNPTWEMNHHRPTT